MCLHSAWYMMAMVVIFMEQAGKRPLSWGLPHWSQVVEAHLSFGAMQEGDERWEVDVGGERKKRAGGKERDMERDNIVTQQPDQFFFTVMRGENKGFATLSSFSGSNSAKRVMIFSQCWAIPAPPLPSSRTSCNWKPGEQRKVSPLWVTETQHDVDLQLAPLLGWVWGWMGYSGKPGLETGCRKKGGPWTVQPRGHKCGLDTANTFIGGPSTKITLAQGIPSVRADFVYSHSLDMYFLSTYYVSGAVLGSEDREVNKQMRFLLSWG